MRTRIEQEADNAIIQETNFEAKKITEKLHIEDRVEISIVAILYCVTPLSSTLVVRTKPGSVTILICIY